MLLSELFDQLSYGELANLAVGEGNNAGIIAEDYAPLIAHINLALTALHKIFPIKMKETIIQEYASIGTYILNTKYAVNGGSTEPIKYIIDTSNKPFVNSVLKIETISNELGVELPLNSPNDPKSLFTPTYNSVQIPNPLNTSTIGVIYRSDHTPITTNNLDPSTQIIDIPASLTEPLLFYIASRAYASVPMLDGVNQSAGYLNKFEASVQRIKNLDLVNDDRGFNNKLRDRGWV